MQKVSTPFGNTCRPFQALGIPEYEAIPPLVFMSASITHTASEHAKKVLNHV